jgi:hypothetical protein
LLDRVLDHAGFVPTTRITLTSIYDYSKKQGILF